MYVLLGLAVSSGVFSLLLRTADVLVLYVLRRQISGIFSYSTGHLLH